MERYSILVLDEDRNRGQNLTRKLIDLGHRVFILHHYNPEWLEIKESELDIIFCTTNVGRNSPVILSQQLHEQYPDLPILLIGEEEQVQFVGDCYRAGASDFLTWPLNFLKLPLLIERLIQRKNFEKERIQKGKHEMLVKILTPLMRALDARDVLTSEHTQRVVDLSMLMADGLKCTDQQRMELQMAAYLHDIGKIGMPDDILKKAAELEDFEITLARNHTVVGSEIIGEIEEFRGVANIIRHHHERYDGSGYPDGLTGENIPVYSRVLAIVDTYEAMVADRIYHKGIAKKVALKEIKQNAGTQFDPKFVELFCRQMSLFIDGLTYQYPIKDDEMIYMKEYCRTSIN